MALDSYDRYLHRGMWRDLAHARMIGEAVYTFPSSLLRLVADHPTFRQTAAGAVVGTLSYSALSGTIVRRAPRLLMRAP